MCLKNIICAEYIADNEALKKEVDGLLRTIAELEAGQPPIPPPPPVFTWQIKSANWVDAQLRALRSVGCQLDIMPLVDEEYRILKAADFREMVKWIGLHQRQFENIFWDCDEFYEAAVGLIDVYFKVNSIAMVADWESGHAYNLGVVLEGAGIYEPQAATLDLNVANRNMGMYGMQRWNPNGYIQI